MTTVHELRETLQHHAEETGAVGVPQRVTEIHRRVGRVRRRRRAGAATVAAVAVAAAALVAVPVLRDSPPAPVDRPEPPRVAGWKLPATERLATTPYRYLRSVVGAPGAQRVTLRLEPSDTARALTWVTSTTTATSVLRVDGREVGTMHGGGMNSGDLLAPDRAHRVSLTLRGHDGHARLGLAVYEQAGALPDGVTDGVVTFRQTIAEDRLLGAVLGRPGEQPVGLDVTLPSLRLRLSQTCYGTDRPLMAEVRVDGHSLGGTSCQVSADPDPGTSGALLTATDRTLQRWGIEPGDTVHVTTVLRGQHGRGDRAARDASAVLGVGLYALGPSAGLVAGQEVRRFTEYGQKGETARVVRTVESKPGARQLRLRLPASDHLRLVSMVATRITGGPVQMFVDGQPGDLFGVGTGSGGLRRLAPGRAHTVRLVHLHGDSPHGRLGLVVSAPVG